MGTAKTVGKQAYHLLTGKVVVHVINLALVVIMARLLGADRYGLFSLTNTFIFMLYTIFNFGVENALGYYIPLYESKGNNAVTKNIMDIVVAMRVITGLIGFLILFIASDYLEAFYQVTDLSIATKIASFGYFGYSVMYLAPSVFQAFKRFKLSMKTDIVNSIIKTILILSTIGFGFMPVMIGHSTALLVSGVFLLIVFYIKIVPKEKFNKELVKKSIRLIAKYSLISYSGAIALFIIGSVGDLLVGSVPMEVSFLNIAHKVGNFIILPATAIGGVLFPNISGISDKKKINNYYMTSTKYILLITTMLSLSVVVFGADIINMVLGVSYNNSKPVINMIVIGYLIYTASLSTQTLYSGVNKPSKTTKAVILHAITTLTLSVILTPSLKAYGSAIAYLSSSAIFYIYLVLSAVKDNYSYNFNYLIRIALTAGVASIAILIDNLITRTAVFIIVFAATGVITKAIKKEDLELLASINKKGI